jgi:cytochrome c
MRIRSTVALAACALLGAGALWAGEALKSVWDGAYTAEQAQRGATEYTNHCVECHQADLAGDGQEIPGLAGPSFLNNWDGLALAALFDRIHDTMPQSNPGSLSAQQATDLTAYLLSANKMPAGAKELPADQNSLKGIRFEAKKPGP